MTTKGKVQKFKQTTATIASKQTNKKQAKHDSEMMTTNGDHCGGSGDFCLPSFFFFVKVSKIFV